MFRRLWSRQVAKGFLLTYMIVALLAGGAIWLRQGDQGKRITTVEQHVVVLERAKLCATVPVCRHLLDNLLADATRSQTQQIRVRLRVIENRTAHRLARAHRRATRRKRSPVARPVPSPAIAPAEPPIAIPATQPTIPEPQHPSSPPALPEVPIHKGAPFGLPCVGVARVEVACQPDHGPPVRTH